MNNKDLRVFILDHPSFSIFYLPDSREVVSRLVTAPDRAVSSSNLSASENQENPHRD